MGIFSSIWDKLRDSVIKQSIQKGIKSIVKLIIAYVASKNAAKYGVMIDEAALTATIYGALTVVTDYIKHKFNIDLKIV